MSIPPTSSSPLDRKVIRKPAKRTIIGRGDWPINWLVAAPADPESRRLDRWQRNQILDTECQGAAAMTWLYDDGGRVSAGIERPARAS